MSELAIEATGLRKVYKDVEALRGVDLRVERGTILGVLGPNGAGKTTAVRILTTLLPPSGGTAKVMGYDIEREGRKLRETIGLAGQYAAVDENLTGFENLEMVGRLYHLGKQRSRRRATELLDRFELDEAGDRLVKTYSGGMRRRLDLAAALVADPPLIFLDEPTTGLDPRSRNNLWRTIEGLVADGTTVLLTTQYLDEADALADRIVVLDHGEIIAEGTADELKTRVGGATIQVTLEEPEQKAAAVAALTSIASEPPSANGTVVTVPIEQRDGAIAQAVRCLDGAGIAAEDLAIRRPTLDDVFIALTGHAAEHQNGSGETAGDPEEER